MAAMSDRDRGPLRVVGRYALYSEIAAGGMATVHIGRLLGPVGFARTVAVKRLHPQFAKDPEFVSMFLDEARLAARVQHPNVVATIDVVATDGELFLIMDYVRGESLSKLLRTCKKQGTRVPPRIAASIICGFLHGLHAAHEAKNERGVPINLVHRDVSPQNVLVGADGIPRVLDFGIAKAQGRVQVTRDGQIKGKLAYMPPEQLSGRDVTRAVDIYASAVVMWETLTGERLFKGETEAETLARILRDPVPSASSVVPSLPKEFDAVLLRALSRDASKRHLTARELAFDLEKCIGVASATEVGEWVENLVGPILSAREDQIAEIEKSSTDLRVLPDSPESSSDAELARLPSAKAGTLLGVGPPSGTMPMGPRRVGPPTPTTALAPVPAALAASAQAHAPAGDEATGSKVTGSRLTGTMALPIDKKLPILASAAGVLVLLVITAVVLVGRSTAERGAPAGSTSGPVTAASTSPTVTPTAAHEPPPPATTDGFEPAPIASSAEKAPPPATATATHTAAPPPHPIAHGTAAPPPTMKTSAPPPPPPLKKNCEPPYTIDANGRKKYKLECM